MQSQLLKLILDNFSTPEVRILLALIALDVLTGLLSALKTGTFELKRLGDFLVRDVFTLAVLYVGLKVVVFAAIPDWDASVVAVFLMVVGTLIGSINENLKPFGISLPNPLRALPAPGGTNPPR